jgi:hypothetical protein
MAVFKLILNHAGVALLNDHDAGGRTEFADWGNPAWRAALTAQINDSIYTTYSPLDTTISQGMLDRLAGS